LTNKNGKTSPAIWVIGTLAVAVLLLFAFGVPQSSLGGAGGGSQVDPTTCADSTATLTINNYSALVGGVDPSPAYTAGIIGAGKNAENTLLATSVVSGTTTFPVGSKVVLFASDGDYLDTFKEETIQCGGSTVDLPMFYSTSDNPVIRVKNDDGDFVADASGVTHSGVNQTDLSAGETLNMDIELQGTNGEASGDAIYVIEFPASSNANISSVTLDGKQPVALPTVHASTNAGSKIVAFDVSGVEGATKKTMTLSVVLASTKDLGGTVLTDWYSKQYIIDDDKTLGYGVEDSDGTPKYENTMDFDFRIEDGAE